MGGERVSSGVVVAVVATVAVLLGIFVWAFVTVVGVMQGRLGLSMWEAVAILVMASFVFGSSHIGVSKS